jgi:hypothetical protein
LINQALALLYVLQKQLAQTADAGTFNEADHPRDEDGRFGSGGSGGRTLTSEAEKQHKIDSIEIDPAKEVNELPRLNKETLESLGKKEDKPVLLKKQVLEKNQASHPDVAPEDFQAILGNSLYRPDAVLPAHGDRPYFNFISRVGKDKSAIALLDVEDTKEGFEVVNWHWIGDRGRMQKEKMAEKIKSP